MTIDSSSPSVQICPSLWFDDQAEEAVAFYTSIFDDSRILTVTHYGEAGHDRHGRPPGSVMEIEFELGGRPFQAINGGPRFTFTPAVSLVVACDTQEEVDKYWSRLTDGGREDRCGWLQDRYGVWWQIVPRVLPELLRSPAPERAARVMNAMLEMVKLDIAALWRAHDGQDHTIQNP